MHLLDEGLSTDGFCFDTALAAYLLSPTDGSYELEKLGITISTRSSPRQRSTWPPTLSAPGRPGGTGGGHVRPRRLDGRAVRGPRPKLEELDMHELYYGLELPLSRAGGNGTGGHAGGPEGAGRPRYPAGRAYSGRRGLIYELAGRSQHQPTQQFGRILFDKGLPPVKKTKTGYSTNADVLEKLRDKHPIVEAVLDYRQLAKLKSPMWTG